MFQAGIDIVPDFEEPHLLRRISHQLVDSRALLFQVRCELGQALVYWHFLLLLVSGLLRLTSFLLHAHLFAGYIRAVSLPQFGLVVLEALISPPLIWTHLVLSVINLC